MSSTVFDRNQDHTVNGRVELLGRLFFSPHPNVVLIRLYSDTRLTELGGAPTLRHQRFEQHEREFNEALRATTTPTPVASDEEFLPHAGVYRELSTGFFICPRCKGEGKRSLMVEGRHGFTCPVCTGFFTDDSKPKASNRVLTMDNPHPDDWMR